MNWWFLEEKPFGVAGPVRKTQNSTHPITTPTNLEVPEICKIKQLPLERALREAVSSGEGYILREKLFY